MSDWKIGKPPKDGTYPIVYRARQWKKSQWVYEMDEFRAGEWKHYHDDEVLAWLPVPGWPEEA